MLTNVVFRVGNYLFILQNISIDEPLRQHVKQNPWSWPVLPMVDCVGLDKF